MNYKFYLISTLIILASCVENFKFPTTEPDQILVIEGFISDVSYNDMIDMPQYPRYFEVELKYASVVSNFRDEVVTGAEVEIVDDLGESWDYTEDEPGIYRLFFEDFKAITGRSYHLDVRLANGQEYQSSVESVPEVSDEGEISFEEAEDVQFVSVAGKFQIRAVKGLNIFVDIPAVENDSTAYYKYDFFSTYSVIALLVRDLSKPINQCWITSTYQQPDVILSKSQFGAREKLFFLSSTNMYINEGYSTLIRQQAMNKDHYQFWSDLQRQEEQADLFAPPPYNLISNLEAKNSDNTVFGYFGVVSEKFYRWNFDKRDLSYPIPVPDWYKERCDPPFPPQYCYDCTLYPLVTDDYLTPDKPWWWYK